MDAGQALADLTEISAQIEAAVLASADGSVLASTYAEPSRGEELARAALELVSAAGEIADGGPELVQLEASTPRGSVFVVRDGDRVVAAITAPKPTVGLIFYDLKTCLRLLGRDEAEPATAVQSEPMKAAETEPAPSAETEADPAGETPAEATPPKTTKVGKATGTRRRTTKKKETDEG